MPNDRIDTIFCAYADACVKFWLMPGGPLGDGEVDHLPVSDDLFAAAFQSIPADRISGFKRGYQGLRDVVRVLSDEQPPGWKRLTGASGRNSLAFLLVAAMSEGNPAHGNFHARLAAELNGDRRATSLERNLEELWTKLREWVDHERRHADSEFHVVRPLMLGSYANSMTRIGTTVELAFPNREDRKTIEPAIERMMREPDPPVAEIVSALSRVVRHAEPLLQRAIYDFQSDPFHCTGIAGCLKAIVVQRLSHAVVASSSTADGSLADEAELLFYRHDDSLLMPYLVAAHERDGFTSSEYLPEPWTHCRQIAAVDLSDAEAAVGTGTRPEVIRALVRGSLGLKQIDGNWFAGAGRVSADAQDAILIRDPPPSLEGCTPSFIPGWSQWFKRDNSQVKGLSAIREQAGLLQSGMDIGFTGGVRIAHTGTFLRVVGFGPRAASSNAAWWTASPEDGSEPTVIQGQEIDVRDLADGSWSCQCFDAMGKSIGSSRVTLVSQLPLRCAFPGVSEHDRVESVHQDRDAASHAAAFLRQEYHGPGSEKHIGFEPLDASGRWYFSALSQQVFTDERGAAGSTRSFEQIRSGRDDLLRVLIGRSCDRSVPVGWGAFADDLQLVMNRRGSAEGGRWSFRHAGAIIRAWEESGFIDIVNRPWAGLCILPRPPRWAIVTGSEDRWRAVSTGLANPNQRNLLLNHLRSRPGPGNFAQLKHAVNSYVPSVIQVDGSGSYREIVDIGREVGLAEPELITEAALRAALGSVAPIKATTDQLLTAQMDRGRFAEDPDQLSPLAIGQIAVQRTRATGSVARWFVNDRRLGAGQGAMTTSRNWAYLLARYRSSIGKPLDGGGGFVIPLREDLPDCFLPISIGRALALCGPRLPGPFMKGADRFYGIPMSDPHRQIISRTLR